MLGEYDLAKPPCMCVCVSFLHPPPFPLYVGGFYTCPLNIGLWWLSLVESRYHSSTPALVLMDTLVHAGFVERYRHRVFVSQPLHVHQATTFRCNGRENKKNKTTRCHRMIDEIPPSP